MNVIWYMPLMSHFSLVQKLFYTHWAIIRRCHRPFSILFFTGIHILYIGRSCLSGFVGVIILSCWKIHLSTSAVRVKGFVSVIIIVVIDSALRFQHSQRRQGRDTIPSTNVTACVNEKRKNDEPESELDRLVMIAAAKQAPKIFHFCFFQTLSYYYIVISSSYTKAWF